MKSYADFSDEELILMYQDGERGIIDFIMEKYKGLVKNKAKSMYLLGADSDDLIQEGMIGLFKAVRDYDPGRDASFFTFADLCVSRQMYNAVQASARQKHTPLNKYISLSRQDLDTNSSGENGSGIELAESPEKNPPVTNANGTNHVKNPNDESTESKTNIIIKNIPTVLY